MSERAHARPFFALLLPVLLLAWGCGEQATTVLAPDPQLAKGGNGGGGGADPVVESVDPTEGEQGQTLDILVEGESFQEGDEVALGIDGTPSEAITTNATTFVGPNTLRANITIAGTAAVTSYDVIVNGGRGRKGIGTALFAVKLGPHANAVVTDLGSLEGRSAAFDINVHGEIVGYDWGNGHGLYWGPDRMLVDLGTGWPEAINEAGQIAGHYTNASGERRGFVTTGAAGAARTELVPLGGHTETRADDINDAGLVVGTSGPPSAPTGAVWDAATGTPVASLSGLPGGSGNSRPFAINSDGHVVGVSSDGSGGTQAVIWLDPDSLPINLTSGADYAYAYGVSDPVSTGNGDIVYVAGQRGHAGDYWATVWTVSLSGGGAVDDFEDLAGSAYAWDVNANGDVVGDIGPSKRGYLWRRSGGTTEALELGALVGRGSSSAHAINESGEIVGWSQVSTKGKDKGLEHAVIWWLP